MTDKKKLTEKQQLVYDSIVDYQMRNGYAPSIRELCVICNLASTSTVYAHLKKLEELGYIRRREDMTNLLSEWRIPMPRLSQWVTVQPHPETLRMMKM